jgi:hypothetical protein
MAQNRQSHPEIVNPVTRQSHPEIVNPVRAKNHENRRVDWLSYRNRMDWNTRAKEFLVDMGMAKD